MEENIIKINVTQRIADHTGGVRAIVADNTEYTAQFAFDEEWQKYPTKTVLFVRDDSRCYPPVVMEGDSCKIPRINGTVHIRVGVTAGDIITTTPAEIRVLGSVLEASAQALDKPAENVWACVVEQLQLLKKAKPNLPIDENGNPVNGTAGQYAKSDGRGGITWGDGPESGGGSGDVWYPTVTDGVISWAKSAAETLPRPADIRGTDGKSAYEYAKDGGYTGTEEEFAAKLAEEMPEKLPNPHALTFSGAVTGTYDGSEAKTIEIPSGGGGGKALTLIAKSQPTEEAWITITEGIDGNPISESELVITAKIESTDANRDINIEAKNEAGSWISVVAYGLKTGTSGMYHEHQIYATGEYIIDRHSQSTALGWNTSRTMYTKMCEFNGKICGIRSSQNAVPAGSVIKLYAWR